MSTQHNKAKRWQFGLKHLFALMTVSAIAAALFAAFGWAVLKFGWAVLGLGCIISWFAPLLVLVLDQARANIPLR